MDYTADHDTPVWTASHAKLLPFYVDGHQDGFILTWKDSFVYLFDQPEQAIHYARSEFL